VAFDFDAEAGRGVRRRDGAFGLVDDFDGVHGLGLHPVDAPGAGMRWGVGGRNVADGAVGAMVANVRRAAAGIPIQKKTWPVMVMHGNGGAGRRYGDFKDAHQGIFENDFVAVRRGLHGVVAFGEIGFVLAVSVEVAGEEDEAKRDQDGKELFSRAEESFRVIHGGQYSEFLMEVRG
jgi:hypothetical protein